MANAPPEDMAATVKASIATFLLNVFIIDQNYKILLDYYGKIIQQSGSILAFYPYFLEFLTYCPRTPMVSERSIRRFLPAGASAFSGVTSGSGSVFVGSSVSLSEYVVRPNAILATMRTITTPITTVMPFFTINGVNYRI